MALRVMWNFILLLLGLAAVGAVSIAVVISLGGHVTLRDLWDFFRASLVLAAAAIGFSLLVIALIVLVHLVGGGPKVPVTSLNAFMEWWDKTGRLQFALGVIAFLVVGWFHYHGMPIAAVVTACVGVVVIESINRRGIGA